MLQIMRLFFVLALTSSHTLVADEYLSPLRDDQLAPQHCKNYKLKNFMRAEEWFVYGIKGAQNRGFDFEYPISRQEANWLWNAFKNNRRPNSWPENLSHEVQLISEYKDLMDFDFKAEGDVLEILALLDLEYRFPQQQYFHTGSVVYHEARSGRILGELDLIVADRHSCEVIAIGESKLGLNALGHAKKQLQRFQNFLRSKQDLLISVIDFKARL